MRTPPLTLLACIGCSSASDLHLLAVGDEDLALIEATMGVEQFDLGGCGPRDSVELEAEVDLLDPEPIPILGGRYCELDLLVDSFTGLHAVFETPDGERLEVTYEALLVELEFPELRLTAQEGVVVFDLAALNTYDATDVHDAMAEVAWVGFAEDGPAVLDEQWIWTDSDFEGGLAGRPSGAVDRPRGGCDLSCGPDFDPATCDTAAGARAAASLAWVGLVVLRRRRPPRIRTGSR